MNQIKSILLIISALVIGACAADEPEHALRQQNRELTKYSSVDATTFKDLNLCPSDKKSLGIVSGYEVRNPNDLVARSTVKIYPIGPKKDIVAASS